MKVYNAGIIGATGMVGQRFATLLANHPWFRVTKLYHRYLENFLAHRSMTLRGKLCILAVSFAAMGVSFWKISVWWVRAILAALALFELYYFRFRIRTVKAADR